MTTFSQDLFSWKCFILVNKYGSIRQAAKDLSLEPSSVSRRLSRLEKELGIELFRFAGKSLTLTPEGEIALKNFAPIVQAHDQAVLNLTRGIAPAGRTLHVIAPIGYSLAIVRRAVTRMADIRPDVHFWLESGLYGAEKFEALGRGIDVIVSTIARENSAFLRREMSDHRSFCFASPLFARENAIERPEALSAIPLAGNTQFITNTVFTHRKTREKVGMSLDFSLLSDNTFFLMDWAACGRGVLVNSPYTAAAARVEAHELVQVLRDWELPNNHVYAYASKKDFQHPGSLLPEFFELLRETSDRAAVQADTVYAEIDPF